MANQLGKVYICGKCGSQVIVTKGGAGYSSPPTVSVPGFDVSTKVELSFGKKLESNGAVKVIKLAADNKN